MPYKDKGKKREYNKQYRVAHKKEIDDWNKQYHHLHRGHFNNLEKLRMQNRKRDGICQDCKQPRLENRVFCLLHLARARAAKRLNMQKEKNREAARARNRVRYFKLKESNRCVVCKMPLNEESRMGVYCLTCYDKIQQYWRYI